MNVEFCPNSLGEPCPRKTGTVCRRPDIGVCDNLIIFEANFLFSHAQQYCRIRNAIGSYPKIAASSNACFIAAKSICDDVYRYSSYHLSDLKSKTANSVKMAAYSCKWIPKIDVFEYSDACPLGRIRTDDISSLTNSQRFALFIAQTYIASELERQFSYKEHYLSEFLYDLLYREINADGLLHIFQMIYSAVEIGQAGILDFPK